MTPDMWLLLLTGVVALLGGAAYLLLSLRPGLGGLRPLRRVLGTVTAVGLAASLGWSFVQPPELPAASAALVLLAMGALLAVSFLPARPGSAPQHSVWGLTLAGVGAAAVAASLLSLGGAVQGEQAGRNYLLVVRLVLAGLGAGAWLPAALASGLFGARRTLQHDPAVPAELPATGRPADPGRLPAVLGYPLLTAALLAAVLWNVLTYAAAWRTALPDLWLLVTWLLGAAYLHATSPWRPLGLPAWFGSLLAAGACGAAVLSALSAGALLVG